MNWLFKRSVILPLTAVDRRSGNFPHISHKQNLFCHQSNWTQFRFRHSSQSLLLKSHFCTWRNNFAKFLPFVQSYVEGTCRWPLKVRRQNCLSVNNRSKQAKRNFSANFKGKHPLLTKRLFPDGELRTSGSIEPNRIAKGGIFYNASETV